jgi:hypothetical protein
MTHSFRFLRLVMPAALTLAVSSPALADWVASGQFFYQDREWDSTGFTGTSSKPIRYADVQVIDVQLHDAEAILATTTTNDMGQFSVSVVDNLQRNVAVRVLSNTTQAGSIQVITNQTTNASIYSYESAPVSNHPSNADRNFGTLTAPMGSGGEAFNILDLGIYGAQYFQQLTGAHPSTLTFKWQRNGNTDSMTRGNVITIRNTGGYDDVPILHEWGHFIMGANSRSSSGAGTHIHDQCDVDIDLSFDEGRASAVAGFVRRAFGMPHANWYLRTTGGSGSSLDFAVDMEATATACATGDENEFNVARCMWDIGDDANTTDDTPGDDNPPDSLARPDIEVYNVLHDPFFVNNTRDANLELFWDGWFAVNGPTYKSQMTSIFQANKVDFTQDAYEANESVGAAKLILPNSGQLHVTFFSDGDQDGQGQGDTDYFKFNAVLNTTYTFQTQNHSCKPIPQLELLDSINQAMVLVTDTDPSTVTSWTAPRTGVFYLRMTHQNGKGIYGSYDLVVTGPVTACGTTNCSATFCFDNDGNTQMCHGAGGGCSGNINTGLIVCQDGATTRSCTGNQKVHLHTCPCVCLGSSCGTRVTFFDCE